MDETVVSWMRQPGPQGNLEVVTAVARQRIVREYEEIVESLGTHVTTVLSSTLATLPLLEEFGASLLARMSGKTLTTAIVHGSSLCVYRATEMATDAPCSILRRCSKRFFRPWCIFRTPGVPPLTRARLAGFGARERVFRDALERELGIAVGPLADSEAARSLESPANVMMYQNLDALVGWMMNEGA